jgi:hypothetical protein
MDILIRSAKAIGSVIGARNAAKWVRSHRRSHRMDHALSRIGLERASSSWPTVGLVALSALVGVGVALVLAPSSGAELRTRLHDRLDEAKRKRSPSASDAVRLS